MQVKPNDPEFQTWLKGVLHDVKSSVCVTFTKKDGTERAMQCTLAENRIPTEKRPKDSEAGKAVGSAVRVFDTEKQEWRSFRWDAIKQVTTTLE